MKTTKQRIISICTELLIDSNLSINEAINRAADISNSFEKEIKESGEEISQELLRRNIIETREG